MDNTILNAKPVDIPEEVIIQSLENEEASITSRLYNSIKRAPFVAIGMASFGIVCGIGAYKWKTKTIPTQLFLIQLRVAAQSTALGCITAGMIYQMYKDYASKQKPT